MGWGHSRRRKKGYGTSDNNVKHFIVEGALKEQVESLMENRHRLLAPFPLIPEEVYRVYWTDEEWAAMQTLKPYQLLAHRRWFEIKGCVGGATLTVNFTDGQVYPVGEHLLAFDYLPMAMQEPIKDWISLWSHYRAEKLALQAKLKEVAKVCKTYGHLLRVWPDIEGFLGDEGKEKLRDKQVRSPYPRDAMDQLVDSAGYPIKWQLKDEFKPAAFEEFSAMIAEALMLPQVDNNKHIAVVRLQGE